MPCFEERNILHTSGSVFRASHKGPSWKDTAEIHFCRNFKNKIVFCTNGYVEGTPNLVHHKVSPMRSFFIAPVNANQAL